MRRVVVADDDLLVRAGLTTLLGTLVDVDVVGSCGSLDELLAMVAALMPDVVITDIRMPPTKSDEGIRAASILRERHPEVGVVILSQYADAGHALALIEHGSNGRAYLLKEHVVDTSQLMASIDAVATGSSLIDASIVDALLAAPRNGAHGRLAVLSARELDVLRELALGKTNIAIAASLYIGERSVEKHISSIFSKLGLDADTHTHRRVAAVLVFLAEFPNS